MIQPMSAEPESLARDTARLRRYLTFDTPPRYCDAALVFGDDPALGAAAEVLWRREMFFVVVLPAAARPQSLPASATLVVPWPDRPDEVFESARAALNGAGLRPKSLLVVCRPTQQRLVTLLGSRRWPGTDIVSAAPGFLDAEANPPAAAHLVLHDFRELHAAAARDAAPPAEMLLVAERLQATLRSGHSP